MIEYSLIGHWTDPQHASRDLGFTNLDRFLGIQDDVGMTTMYFPADLLAQAHAHLVELQREKRDELLRLLRKGQELYEAGMQRVDSNQPFHDLVEAAEYFCEIGKFTVVLPAWMLNAFEAAGVKDSEIQEIAEFLRGHSVYPRLVQKLLHPYAIGYAQQLGLPEPEQAPHLVAWDELHCGVDRETWNERLTALKQDKRFVFEMDGHEIRVRFLSQTGYLLMRLATKDDCSTSEDPNLLKGQAAWPGYHRGRARVVLSSNPEGYALNEGDILISIQCNPNLMPLLRHAGAIVTDEGGVACHAGIVARELRVPAVIATGDATSKIHDGDLIEVDATEQVVRILERA
ncbi:MAG: PEP-utilizing enzyme [Verrucomicrobiota bacterium]